VAIQRRRGAFDQAIESARYRSFLVNACILLVLAGGIVLLFISAQRARHLAMQQKQFAASVSHELRTPISVISNAAANLADGVIDRPDQVRRYGDMLRTHARNLSEMIEHALWFAKSPDHAPLLTEEVSPGELIDTAVEVCGPILREAGIKIERYVDGDVALIEANRTLILQALQNLLNNVARYASSGSWAKISAVRRDDQIVFSVEDHGPGISAADLPRIFEPFYRGGTTRAPVGGLGLGLTLFKQIVEAHRGTVYLDSTHQAGTTIGFALPIHIKGF
jgi:signal transduction histidine kinase